MSYELAIIGAGNMAEAIARGVLAEKVLSAEQIIAADVSAERRALFESMGVRAVEQNVEAARQAQTLLLSVKPQQMTSALAGIGQAIGERTLVISIAAGTTTRSIERHLGEGRAWRIVRAMPNTPMLVGAGMVAISPGAHASGADLAQARRLFEAAAEVIELPEERMDAVTALSGSGPAYFFFLVEQMIRAGTDMGLTPEQARRLVIRTAVGAATMMAKSSDAPEVLRRKVTSPGGTTAAAIGHMEAQGWARITVDAIKAAEQRGRELSGS